MAAIVIALPLSPPAGRAASSPIAPLPSPTTPPPPPTTVKTARSASGAAPSRAPRGWTPPRPAWAGSGCSGREAPPLALLGREAAVRGDSPRRRHGLPHVGRSRLGRGRRRPPASGRTGPRPDRPRRRRHAPALGALYT